MEIESFCEVVGSIRHIVAPHNKTHSTHFRIESSTGMMGIPRNDSSLRSHVLALE